MTILEYLHAELPPPPDDNIPSWVAYWGVRSDVEHGARYNMALEVLGQIESWAKQYREAIIMYEKGE